VIKVRTLPPPSPFPLLYVYIILHTSAEEPEALKSNLQPIIIFLYDILIKFVRVIPSWFSLQEVQQRCMHVGAMLVYSEGCRIGIRWLQCRHTVYLYILAMMTVRPCTVSPQSSTPPGQISVLQTVSTGLSDCQHSEEMNQVRTEY
jgi:hypothetical protein